MESLDANITQILSERKHLENLRTLRIPAPSLIDFSSNDYLGLSRSTELRTKIHAQILHLDLPNGSTGSRLLTGNSLLAEQVEKELSMKFKAEACLLFNSGYAANIGVLSSIPRKGDVVLYDERSHASIKDGIRLSLATRHPFRHNDLNDLEGKIQRSKGRVFVVVESIYSMDGDESPIPELIRLKNKYDFELIVDEAHSTGTTGVAGEGSCIASQLQTEITARIYTFGKALGTHGACVALSENLKQYLINFSRPFIYSTALPPHTLISIREGFAYINDHPELLNSLRKNIRCYLESIHPDLRTESISAIQTVIVSGNARCREAAGKLNEKGFDVRPILSPTVPLNAERLRICLHSFNTESEIRSLAEALNEWRISL